MDDELRAVVRAALSGVEQPETGSFMTDVWDKAEALRVRPVRTIKPGPRKRRHKPSGKRPDVPKEVRRQQAAGRLAIKATAWTGLTPSGGPLRRPPRRIAKSDWNGAYNVFFARRDAAALRNAGYPMIPS